MEYLAKITHGQKLESSHLWKYTFLDTQTSQEGYFYHNQQIDYNPNLAGRLSISSNKFLQSFKKEIEEIIERSHQSEILTDLEGKARSNVDRVFNRLGKRKIELSPQILHKIHDLGYTWKEVGRFYQRSEPTIHRWIKPYPKPLQKRGRKPVINEALISLLRSYVLQNNTKIQQQITDYICKELDIKISRPSITVLLKKMGITRKKLTYHYNQLDKEKAKEFNNNTRPLFANYPFLALDECSFYFNSDPRYGYSLKGKRAINKKPSNRGEHYTLLFVISSQKGVIIRLMERFFITF